MGISQGIIKTFVALLLAAAAYCYIAMQTSNLQKASGEEGIPFRAENFEKAIIGMKETNDLLINWAIVLLGSTLGIAILAKGAKIRDRNWGMILIPPTWVFLWGSLKNGSDFKRSLTFQLAKGDYKFFKLNLHLYLQMDFFQASLYVLAFLAAIYLFFRFALMEERSDGGQ